MSCPPNVAIFCPDDILWFRNDRNAVKDMNANTMYKLFVYILKNKLY